MFSRGWHCQPSHFLLPLFYSLSLLLWWLWSQQRRQDLQMFQPALWCHKLFFSLSGSHRPELRQRFIFPKDSLLSRRLNWSSPVTNQRCSVSAQQPGESCDYSYLNSVRTHTLSYSDLLTVKEPLSFQMIVAENIFVTPLVPSLHWLLVNTD